MDNKKLLIVTLIGIMTIMTIALANAQEERGSYPGALTITQGDGGVYTIQGPPKIYCGDGQLQTSKGEQCDGNIMGGATCESLGYDGGTLSCQNNCIYDTTQCTTNPPTTPTTNTGSNTGSGGGGGSGGGASSSSKGICIESWECVEWTECNDEGISTRTCLDKNNCGTTNIKPEETVECSIEDEENQDGGRAGITGAVVGTLGSTGTIIIAIIIILVVVTLTTSFMRKKKGILEKE